MKAFLEMLTRPASDGSTYKASYEGMRRWHWDRDAPVHYLERVVKVFPQVRLEYLVNGDGALTHEEQRSQDERIAAQEPLQRGRGEIVNIFRSALPNFPETNHAFLSMLWAWSELLHEPRMPDHDLDQHTLAEKIVESVRVNLTLFGLEPTDLRDNIYAQKFIAELMGALTSMHVAVRPSLGLRIQELARDPAYRIEGVDLHGEEKEEAGE